MFCPKCGNQLPDGSAFCGQCGAQLGQPQAATAPAAAPAGGVSLGGISGVRLVAVVLAAVAAVFALMPWFVTSSSLMYAGETASAVSSFLTMGSYSTAHFEESYTMFGLMDFVRDLGSYFGASSSSSGGVVIPMTAFWAIGLIGLVAGAILAVVRGNRVVLIVGAVVLALTALYYTLLFYGPLVEGDYAVGCINPVACAVACLASAVFAVVDKSKAVGKKA